MNTNQEASQKKAAELRSRDYCVGRHPWDLDDHSSDCFLQQPTTTQTPAIAATKTTERAWAAHLDTCMDMDCATCAEFSAAIYGA